MNILKNTKIDWMEYSVVLIAFILSIGSYLWSYINGYAVIYNDSMAHLNISRLVIDNIAPGMAQIGSVWLPLNHVLNLTLIWNDWAWHSGFAGSFFSMLAYVVSVWGIYKIIIDVTKSKWASAIGAMVFALNVNMLYLQTTPLTEPLYISFFILSIFAFVRWMRTDDLKFLLLFGLCGLLQVLTRYDGWFVVGVEFGALLAHEIMYRKEKFGQIVGRLTVFAFPIIFGIGIWLLWNWLIFGNPLFFAFGDNSAHAQQDIINQSSGLITKHDLSLSVKAYWYSMVDNFGNYITVLLAFGILFFCIKKISDIKMGEKILLIIIFLSPFLFNVLALYLGFSVINMPELNWTMALRGDSHWFNVRYGVIMLPALAFFVGIVISVYRNFIIIISLMFVFIMYQNFLLLDAPIILAEGTYDVETSEFSNVANTLKQVVGEDEKVLISTAIFSSVMFETGFPLKKFIHEGTGEKWISTLKLPNEHARWIVIRENYIGDPVYRSLIKNDNNNFFTYYKLAHKFRDASIYELKTQDEIMISVQDDKLMVGDDEFVVRGINFYDLAYKSKQDIVEALSELSAGGVNTIRFWAFGDGNSDGFQTEAGMMNEERLERMDFVITVAEKYNIRLIPVLVNNWDDYGGKTQYLKWTGEDIAQTNLFFSEEKSKNLFKNYIDHIVVRQNTITGNTYNDEAVILAWELMNEPRIIEKKQKDLQTWTTEMSAYIKSIDQNHLVSIGSEEEVRSGDVSENKAFGLCAIANIDICSTHLYLFHEDKIIYDNFDDVEQFLKTQFDFAQKLNKPILVGEFGVPKHSQPFGEESLKTTTNIKNSVNKIGYNGYLIWNWNSVVDDSFAFSFESYGDDTYNSANLQKLMK